MPRIRSIKPEHWSDKELPNISLAAQLLWIGMWNFADDKGINEADLFLIRSQVFPRRQDVTIGNVTDWIGQLVKTRFLIPFSYKGENYFITRTFGLHQKIDKPKPSNIPQKIIDAVLNIANQSPEPPLLVDDDSTTNRRMESELVLQADADHSQGDINKGVEKIVNELLVNNLNSLIDESATNRRRIGDESDTGEERRGDREDMDKDRIRRGDTPPDDFLAKVIFDVESELLADQKRYESIVMSAHKTDKVARDSLHKYHLHLQEKEIYPKTKNALFAGFEKWLLNEKNFEKNGETSKLTATGSPVVQSVVGSASRRP